MDKIMIQMIVIMVSLETNIWIKMVKITTNTARKRSLKNFPKMMRSNKILKKEDQVRISLKVISLMIILRKIWIRTSLNQMEIKKNRRKISKDIVINIRSSKKWIKKMVLNMTKPKSMMSKNMKRNSAFQTMRLMKMNFRAIWMNGEMKIRR